MRKHEAGEEAEAGGAPPRVEVFDSLDGCPDIGLVEGKGSSRAVIWPGTGAQLRSMHLVNLAAGARTVEMRHRMEAVYYVIVGTVVASDPSTGTAHSVGRGSMIFVEPDTPYILAADGKEASLVGGPCPPDRDLYRSLE